MSNGGLNMLYSPSFLIYLTLSLACKLGYIRINCSLSPLLSCGAGVVRVAEKLRKVMINQSNF